MRKIVCLWGGPGTGKSTTCAGIFNLLKKKGYNCEMNREYVKEWVWEGREIKEGDQSYIFSKQARKERQYIKEGLDFIISDSPMALSIYYGDKYDKYEKGFGACRVLLKQHHQFCKDNNYKVEHIFLVRQKEYNPSGRLQTEEEAKQFDIEIKDFMDSININYKIIECGEMVEKHIVDILEEKNESKN